ncbi:uncharacterized protein LOC123215708 [Mangifera indica]|uniref:uncharacterized protein LOC123215708 n=1 Tax=Mangifera indica TaxID=29780 RepID=UPI001CFB75AE|nr:uncharacterized protein LOC123215708 [Mangifera indica]
MDHQEKPVLSRLDRLDRLVQLLEERHYSSSRVTTKLNKEEECKTLSSALEEVNHKGTLMERLTMLESQVLQLSLKMEVGNTSKSSSSTVQLPEKDEPKSSFSVVTGTTMMYLTLFKSR